MTIKNRIKYHRRVKASELVPHELNPRTHSDAQRDALKALYDEIGFARSLLAYELPDGKLKLIDGHLRQSMDPDMEVEVEVLDVTDDEARKLLLSIDPLAQLAGFNQEAVEQLRQTVESASDAVNNLWNSIATAGQLAKQSLRKRRAHEAKPIEQYLVIVECSNETEQIALLKSLRQKGHQCRALVS